MDKSDLFKYLQQNNLYNALENTIYNIRKHSTQEAIGYLCGDMPKPSKNTVLKLMQNPMIGSLCNSLYEYEAHVIIGEYESNIMSYKLTEPFDYKNYDAITFKFQTYYQDNNHNSKEYKYPECFSQNLIINFGENDYDEHLWEINDLRTMSIPGYGNPKNVQIPLKIDSDEVVDGRIIIGLQYYIASLFNNSITNFDKQPNLILQNTWLYGCLLPKKGEMWLYCCDNTNDTYDTNYRYMNLNFPDTKIQFLVGCTENDMENAPLTYVMNMLRPIDLNDPGKVLNWLDLIEF